MGADGGAGEMRDFRGGFYEEVGLERWGQVRQGMGTHGGDSASVKVRRGTR